MGVRVSDGGELIRATLRSVRIFAGWSDRGIDALCAVGQLWRFEKSESLWLYGDELDGLWVVAEGSLLSYRDNPDGRRMIQGVVMPGDLYGLAPLFDGRAAMTDVAARSPSTALVLLPREPLLALMREDADRLLDVILAFSNRLRIDYERAQIGLNSSLRCQLAKYVAFFSGEDFQPFLDGKATDWAPPIAVTQEEIAGMMGVSRQSVSEQMAAMVRDGVLKRGGGQFRVNNYRKLLVLMEEDEAIAPDWRAFILARHEALAELRSAGRNAALAAEMETGLSQA